MESMQIALLALIAFICFVQTLFLEEIAKSIKFYITQQQPSDRGQQEMSDGIISDDDINNYVNERPNYKNNNSIKHLIVSPEIYKRLKSDNRVDIRYFIQSKKIKEVEGGNKK